MSKLGIGPAMLQVNHWPQHKRECAAHQSGGSA